jgi:hypothetical protein
MTVVPHPSKYIIVIQYMHFDILFDNIGTKENLQEVGP